MSIQDHELQFTGDAGEAINLTVPQEAIGSVIDLAEGYDGVLSDAMQGLHFCCQVVSPFTNSVGIPNLQVALVTANSTDLLTDLTTLVRVQALTTPVDFNEPFLVAGQLVAGAAFSAAVPPTYPYAASATDYDAAGQATWLRRYAGVLVSQPTHSAGNRFGGGSLRCWLQNEPVVPNVPGTGQVVFPSGMRVQ